MVVVRTVDQRQQHVLKSMPSWPERTRPERIQVCSAVYDALRVVWVDARTKRTDVCSAVYDAK